MNKEFVSYEQAVALKELGFDEPCLCFYNKHIIHHHIFMSNINDINNQPKNSELTEISITAPLKQQVFRWFREKYDAHIHPRRIIPNVYIAEYALWESKAFDTYEEAESACIDKLIELIKQQDNG